MPKRSGLGMNLYVGSFNASGDIQALSTIQGGPAVLDFTDITKSAMERKGGKRSGGIGMTTFFNPASPTGIHHSIIGDLPTADVIVTAATGTIVGAPAASLTAKQLNYDPTRPEDGALTFAVDTQSNAFGLEWGNLLTPGVRTDTTATNGAALDHGAFTAFDGQAYLHVFAFTGTSATVKIQDSPDGSAWTDTLVGIFTTVTAPTSERLPALTGGVLGRFTRVVTVGTFSSLVFAVVIARNFVATVF